MVHPLSVGGGSILNKDVNGKAPLPIQRDAEIIETSAERSAVVAPNEKECSLKSEVVKTREPAGPPTTSSLFTAISGIVSGMCLRIARVPGSSDSFPGLFQ